MILVTGAGGTVGSQLTAALQRQGHRFRVAHHAPDKVAQAIREGHDAVRIDFDEPGTLPPALAGIEAAFLLGTGIRGQAEREINFVSAAKTAGVTKLVKLSIWRAADEHSALAKMHRQVEKGVEASGLAWTFLRCNGFMQNFSTHMIKSINEQSKIYQPAAAARISHIDARDIASVAAVTLTMPGHNNKAYELSGPEALSYDDAAQKISNIAGRKVTYVPLAQADARAGMLAAGMPDIYVDSLLDLFRAYWNGIAANVTSDVQDVTGHSPISFDKFLRDHVAAFTITGKEIERERSTQAGDA